MKEIKGSNKLETDVEGLNQKFETLNKVVTKEQTKTNIQIQKQIKDIEATVQKLEVEGGGGAKDVKNMEKKLKKVEADFDKI